MPLLAAIVLTVLAQDKTATHGKTNAQILAMGRKAWYDFYTGKDGDSTAGMTSAEGLYGDALAWRNDRLKPKTKVLRLRTLLQDVKNEAVAVGSGISGGGTMWNITSASLYADAEQTIYHVMTKTGRAPKRVVSDVNKAYESLGPLIKAADEFLTYKKEGLKAHARLRGILNGVIAEARKEPRAQSDALLDFCVQALRAADSN